jgi:Bacteriophage head to tail connecting protein
MGASGRPDPMPERARDRLERRLGELRTERTEWIRDWQELSDHLLPRRSRFLERSGGGGTVGSNRRRRSARAIMNPMATYALRTSTAGMQAGLTSPAARWFRLTTEDAGLAEREGVRAWLDAVEDRLYRVLAKSNFYQQVGLVDQELLAFGTGPLWHDESREFVCNFTALTVGEYMLANDASGLARICYREYEMTVFQLVEQFGLDRVSRPVREAYDRGEYGHWHVVAHATEPYSPIFDELYAEGGSLRRWAYVSVYWEMGAPAIEGRKGYLRVSGYDECPVHAPRWDVTTPDAYGRGPAEDALPDIKGLQALERRKLQVVDRVAGYGPTQGPPLIGGRPDLSPDAYNPVPPGKDYTIRPIFDINPNAMQIYDVIARQNEARIERGLYSDLFIMFALAERGQPITATEVAERKEEKLLVLGPVVTRLNHELLDPTIDRTFNILLRASVPLWQAELPAPLPPPPEELTANGGADLKVEYVSMLQTAMQQVRAGGVQRILELGNVIRASFPDDPSRVDKLDYDQAFDELAVIWGAPARLVRSDDEVEALRAQRAEEQAAAQQTAELMAAAQAAPGLAAAAKDVNEIEQSRQGGAPA